jgi:hypothetical protein
MNKPLIRLRIWTVFMQSLWAGEEELVSGPFRVWNTPNMFNHFVGLALFFSAHWNVLKV